MGRRDDDGRMDDSSITAGRRPLPDFATDGEMTQSGVHDGEKTVVGKPKGGRGALGVRPVIHDHGVPDDDAVGPTVRLEMHPDDVIPLPKVETLSGADDFLDDDEPTLGVAHEDVNAFLNQKRKPERTDPVTRMPTSPGELSLGSDDEDEIVDDLAATPHRAEAPLVEPANGVRARAQQRPDSDEAEAPEPRRSRSSSVALGETADEADVTGGRAVLGETANEPLVRPSSFTPGELADQAFDDDLEAGFAGDVEAPEDPGSVTATFYGKVKLPQDLGDGPAPSVLPEQTDAEDRRRAPVRADSLLSRIGTPVSDDPPAPMTSSPPVGRAEPTDQITPPPKRPPMSNQVWWLAALAVSLMALGIVLAALMYKGAQ